MTDIGSVFDITMKELWKEVNKDGTITPEEEKKLNELKNMIMDRAKLIAKIDSNFDEDEQALVKRL